MIEENYWNIRLGLSLNDLWFIKENTINKIDMRKIVQYLAVVAFFAFSQKSQAQDSETCLKLIHFAESAKVKDYDSAYTPWMAVRSECPSLNVAIYTYGERILKHKLKMQPMQKKAFADDLIALYDEWMTNFPTKKE